MPETNYYVVASLTVNTSGDWLLFDSNPMASIRFPKKAIHWQRGTSVTVRFISTVVPTVVSAAVSSPFLPFSMYAPPPLSLQAS
jgi:hypothetical protein